MLNIILEEQSAKWEWRLTQNRRCTSTSCGHCNTCMIICWKVIAFGVFGGCCTQSGTHQRRLIKNIHVKHNRWEPVKWRSMLKQNRRCTSTSCGHCNTCMIICWKVIAFGAFGGCCTQSGTRKVWRTGGQTYWLKLLWGEFFVFWLSSCSPKVTLNFTEWSNVFSSFWATRVKLYLRRPRGGHNYYGYQTAFYYTIIGPLFDLGYLALYPLW